MIPPYNPAPETPRQIPPPALSEIERAQRIGTYGKIDRSLQYQGRNYTGEALRRNDDILFARWREKEKYELRDQVILIVLAAVIARIDLIVAFMVSWWRQ